MTRETRTFIDAGDISGIEIECQNCKVKNLFPISKCSKIGVHCPHCDKKWFDSNDDSVCPALNNLYAVATNLVALNTTRTDIHARIRVHLNPFVTSGS